MKRAEIFFAVLILIGFIFKLLHWSYNSEIIALSTLLLSLLYFFFGFALLNKIRFRDIAKSISYKGISKLRIFGAIATGVVFSFLVVYSLFKLMFWPFGQEGLGLSLQLLSALAAIILVVHLIKNRSHFFKLNSLRFIIIGILSVIIYTVNNDQLVDLYYGSDPEYAEEYKTYLKDSNPDAKRPEREFTKSND